MIPLFAIAQDEQAIPYAHEQLATAAASRVCGCFEIELQHVRWNEAPADLRQLVRESKSARTLIDYIDRSPDPHIVVALVHER